MHTFILRIYICGIQLQEQRYHISGIAVPVYWNSGAILAGIFIFELLHRRRKKSSTIFCSQYEFEEWYDQLGGDDSPLADAIIDRIAHDSYRINITSIDAEHDKSMREVYGLDKALRE